MTNPTDILARTAWAEARGDGEPGMHAVCSVVLNRLAISKDRGGRYWWGTNIPAICTMPWQFSCWNADDPNLAKLKAVTTADKSFLIALRLAADAVAGKLPDITKGSTSYKVTSLPWPKGMGPGT